ncbi:C4-type zinc ribbon domain-containing protein [Nocardiopsis exhalans]|uniref:C4-type zinc ribbon domain-containing protein n=1 Tax=Nocardiopsis exhalans TaxID=163604 RepID=A0ABY5D3I5_9ACTN|nr:C4-type zinc ribbon domain-containing protein [Nocardiopsis exhalans]USY17757.1 C4-type zinc ribbon domain-containing protein [Nocardiopsis exhalans]
MKAEPAAQARLLDLQELDTQLERLDHRLRSLTEIAEAAQLKERVDAIDAELITAQTKASDVERHQRKAESDVDQVRSRADRDAKRLESGQITNAKELQNLQSEIESLGRRQAELEEVVLEVMEQAEGLSTEVARLTEEREAAVAKFTEVTARRDTAAAEIQWDRTRVTQDRERVSAEIPADLLALYDKLRAQYDGVAAAPLRYGRCNGCKLALSTVELNEIRATAADQIVRCEDCRRILVRTEESGLTAPVVE